MNIAPKNKITDSNIEIGRYVAVRAAEYGPIVGYGKIMARSNPDRIRLALTVFIDQPTDGRQCKGIVRVGASCCQYDALPSSACVERRRIK